MALSLNTPVGSKIRCIARSDLVGGRVSSDPIKIGEVYTLREWCRPGYHMQRDRRYIWLKESGWVCSCLDFDLVSHPDGWGGHAYGDLA